MNKIYITDFGPVKHAEINLDTQMQILIGAQASGKSTVCKIVYFCQKIRDYTLDYLLDAERFLQNHKNEYFNNYMKHLSKQFMGCFGKTTHMKPFKIEYIFCDNSINVTLNKDGFVRFRFSTNLRRNIEYLIVEAASFFLEEQNNETFNSIIDKMNAVSMLQKELRTQLWKYFNNDKEIIYIPAGRSLLATLSDQFQNFSPAEMDLTMQEFINLIRVTKGKFGTKIPEMLKTYTKTVKGQVKNDSLNIAYRLIKEIFKADYTSESDGEKIYFDEYHWVKLALGSSGQQEVLWILMLAYIIILEQRKCFVIIEEPEAHLFPIAQKRVVELIVLMLNSTGSRVIITTHSPYILTSLNILLYSSKVESSSKNSDAPVVSKNIRIAFDNFAAYKVGTSETGMESLMDESTHMIDTGYIDEVSAITNEELDRLFAKEFEE